MINTKKKWRLVKHIETNGAMQMAIDEAMLVARSKGLVPNTLRFFSWKPVCLSIGYFQSLEKEIDVKKTKEQGVDIVRRYTGGGAVLHDKELTYTLAVNEKDVSLNIIKSYEIICSAIIRGLKKLNIKSEFKPINDILVGNKKISGNAQTRKKGVLMQHGTILIDVDVKKMFSLLKVPDEKIKDKMIKTVEERVTSIQKEIGQEVRMEKLSEMIRRGFEEVFGVEFEESELTEYELQIAEKLFKEKYSQKEWSYLR
jgi:lipoate---protein ligase